MKNLAHPRSQKRRNQIPIIAYKNNVLLFEAASYQEAIKQLIPYISCSGKEQQDAVWDGAFNHVTWHYNGDEYDFRTSEERRLLGVIRRKKPQS